MLRSLLKYLSTHPSMALEVSLQMVPTSSPTGAKLYSTRAPSKLSLRPVVETPVDSENSPGYRPGGLTRRDLGYRVRVFSPRFQPAAGENFF